MEAIAERLQAWLLAQSGTEMEPVLAHAQSVQH